MRTLDAFVDDGRVNYIGTSTEEPNAWKVVKANELARREGTNRSQWLSPGIT